MTKEKINNNIIKFKIIDDKNEYDKKNKKIKNKNIINKMRNRLKNSNFTYFSTMKLRKNGNKYELNKEK